MSPLQQKKFRRLRAYRVKQEPSNHTTVFPAACNCNSPSTLLISPAPKPVKVLLCFGREIPAGPTPPVMSTMGAEVEGRRSLVGSRCSVAMVFQSACLGISKKDYSKRSLHKIQLHLTVSYLYKRRNISRIGRGKAQNLPRSLPVNTCSFLSVQYEENS